MPEATHEFEDVQRIGAALLAHGYPDRLQDIPEGRQLLAASPDEQRQFVLRALAFLRHSGPAQWTISWRILEAIGALLRRRLPFTADEVGELVAWASRGTNYVHVGSSILKTLDYYLRDQPLTPQVRAKAETLLAALQSGPADASIRQLILKLQDLLGVTEQALPLEPGDVWADVALDDIRALEDPMEDAWRKLLQGCATASAGAPTTKWLAAVRPSLETIGFASFKALVLRWFPLADKPRTEPLTTGHAWLNDRPLLLQDRNADILKGLAWLCGRNADREVARALTALAVSAYRKIPGIGPRAPRVGNACVWALGEMPGQDGLAQLSILKSKVRFGTAQRMIETAMAAAAKREGLDPAEIEELLVPTYGLEEVGVRREQLGTVTAELEVAGTTNVALRWKRPDGKYLASVPREVKEQHGEALAELTQAANDIKKMLPAQRDRIENLYLERKSWPVAVWRERYLDHPLVGTLARRLIWRLQDGERTASGIWQDGRIVGHDDVPIAWVDQAASVELWHPLHDDPQTVQAWRAWLTAHEVQQPFKQAHREVYVLTDAERATGVYSNRFAAHILRQHQFNALAAARGWKNALRLMVDDEYHPAERRLAAWDLRAEFWIEGAGQEYGIDTNETGTYLYLTTDQVRFYPLDAPRHSAHAGGGGYRRLPHDGGTVAAPVPQENVPALVFSEIMRDVDLFVGVASVVNDPTWADGGTDRPYQQYWATYAFGELAETAKLRREVLAGLVPRLKIASRCTLTERFLVVRGDLRTYKIHLGSGNILMEPNDQYLCIVPARGGATVGPDKLFLPFEGDTMLAIILSKALLLANDTSIQDKSILNQIP